MTLSSPAEEEKEGREAPAGLRSDVDGAVERGELALAYQPVVWLPTGLPLGFEALLRWNHPVHGVIPPADLVPAAEATGAIIDMGRWALRESLRQMGRWRDELPGCSDLMIAVNISGVQMQDPGFGAMVREALTSSSLDPEALLLELTESVLLPDTVRTTAGVRELRALGTRVAIDDFGTGFSSLTYLRELPVTTIKVDRSFVHDLQRPGSRSPQIVRAVLSLADSLGLETIVEGVETTAQEAQLREMGATLAQGYRWSRPLDPVDVPVWLAASARDDQH
ncbi:MAG TPA: EAL domain-containing protein [Ornithinimicrobium sp.]|uniref:putative bifunctional diguanylate cyclase/phosphodiesterase n=1 Tax=Ornithinimicrobium sp. TaxID=1977084 RepID=UPI002B461E3B|nr:EAL domain-containing protein [Ornithinimicrobium sp.]HKJ11379.1 EAL domain-containing protein [Ornithinimicrobium sp.]